MEAVNKSGIETKKIKKKNNSSLLFKIACLLCIAGYIFRINEISIILTNKNIFSYIPVFPLDDIVFLFKDFEKGLYTNIILSIYCLSIAGLFLLLLNKNYGFKIWLISRVIFYCAAFFIIADKSELLFIINFGPRIIVTLFFVIIIAKTSKYKRNVISTETIQKKRLPFNRTAS